jgi:hypothetical protein
MKVAFLASVHAGHVGAREADGDDHTRQAAASANVHQAGRRAMPLQRCDDRQAVHQVVAQHLRWITDGRQVVDLVPLLQQGEVGQQLVELGIAQV